MLLSRKYIFPFVKEIFIIYNFPRKTNITIPYGIKKLIKLLQKKQGYGDKNEKEQ